MRSSVVRTAVISSVVTAVAVSAISLFAMSRLGTQSAEMDNGLQPAMYNEVVVPAVAYTQPATSYRAPARRAAVPARVSSERPVYRPAVSNEPSYEPVPAYEPVYDEPEPQRRSTKTSAMIVAGSAGAGAAIGGIAGGGKGAAIGAIAGGVGGLIYDRATVNKSGR